LAQPFNTDVEASSSTGTALVTDVLKEAIEQRGKPEIFNPEQGSPYTSQEHTGLLKSFKIQISMNGKGRSIDNIAIERFFRALKYEEVYIHDYRNIKDLRIAINRFHSALKYKKPMEVYRKERLKAA